MSIQLDLITILEKTISPEQQELQAAQSYLDQAAAADLIGLLRQLSDILRNTNCSPVARMQAGLQLKNAINSKDPQTKQFYQQRWLQFAQEHRSYIRLNCLYSLGSEQTAHSSAAQCVAYIACAEIPAQQWPDLMQQLVHNVTKQDSTESVRHATLEAIGYICQDIDPTILSSQSNDILTAIVCGMHKNQTSDHVRLAATNALLNSLEFTRQNFDNVTERDYIMQVVCETTQSQNSEVRVAALQCLVKIMSLYYVHMEYYMGPALFAITLEAMKSDVDQVALQGIEFWSSVCDEEIDLAYEASEYAEKGVPPPVSSKFYAKGALRYIVPILLDILRRQEESDDEDEWNPCKAAGVCIMLLAQCCEDDIIELVIPFVRENIKNSDWRYRDAAVMSFGSIIEGPEPEKLKGLVESAMPVIIELLRDPSAAVRDTAAWTIGRVCEILPETALSDVYLPALLDALVTGLSAEPRVAANVCWAFHSLAEGASELAKNRLADQDGDQEPMSYALSQYFAPIIQRLLNTAERADGSQNHLRNAAYSALMELMKSAPRDCYQVVLETTEIVLDRLEKLLQMESHVTSSQQRLQLNDMQSLLCGTLQSVMRKIDRDDALKIADKVMLALLNMFQRTATPIGAINGEDTKAGGVQEDALLVISALLDAVGDYFLKYMDAFLPILVACLNNFVEKQVCMNAVGLLGDLCRVLQKHMGPYCDALFAILMEVLRNPTVDKAIRPEIISTFGDIALALGSDFGKYMDAVIHTLHQASQAQVDLNDPDMVEYLNALRTSCLEAYTGIIQGLKGDSGGPSQMELVKLQAALPYILQFVEQLGNDPISTDAIVAAACGLIGDLVTAFGTSLLAYVERDSITALLTKGRRSKESKTKSLAVWATKEIRKLRNNIQQQQQLQQAQQPQQQQA